MTSVPAVQLLLPSCAEKRCSRCGDMKPLAAFSLALRRKDHHAGHCKACMADHGRRAQTNPATRERHRRQSAEHVARKKAGLPPRPRKLTDQVYTPPNLRRRGTWLMRAYGVTPKQYEIMWIAQRGLCAICGQPETKKGRGGDAFPLGVDHCHDTGKVRALLCAACNIGIGNLQHDPDRLERAAAYLRKHGT